MNNNHYDEFSYSPMAKNRKMKISRRLQARVVHTTGVAQPQACNLGERNTTQKQPIFTYLHQHLFTCNSATACHYIDANEEILKHTNQWSLRYRTRSPQSVFNPILRTIECGGGGDERLLHNNPQTPAHTSQIEPLQESTTSDSMEQSCLSAPLMAIHMKQKERRHVVKEAMLSFFARESTNINSKYNTNEKRVTFQYPLVTSIFLIPRINDEDIHRFFFTDVELEQLEQDSRNTLDSENIESVLLANSSPNNNKFNGIYYVLQRSCNEADTWTNTYSMTMTDQPYARTTHTL